jgi:hypothetical protein
MSGEPDNLVLVYLRRIDANIGQLIDDVQDPKRRVSSHEGQMTSVRADMTAMPMRVDQIEPRLDRIERQLEFGAAPTIRPGCAV